MDNTRREFLKGTAWMGAAALATGCVADRFHLAASGGTMFDFACKPMSRIRIGFVGVGGRGTGAVKHLMHIPTCEITAICDINPERLAEVRKLIADQHRPPAKEYGKTEEDWKRLCDSDDIDVVYSCLPRELHGVLNVYALNAGKHVLQEVPGCFTLDECWATVEAAEKNRRHCMMLENCCYGEYELLAFNLVKHGFLGKVMQANCAYIHDQRKMMYAPRDGKFWRIARHRAQHGNYYPTHSMTPMTKCMDVNRGDRFETLVSMETDSQSFEEYAASAFPAGDRRRDWRMVRGDINNTLIRTAKGCIVNVEHNVSTPRPYSRGNMLEGSRGFFRSYPELMMCFDEKLGDGKGNAYFSKEQVAEIREKYMHPLWRTAHEFAAKVGGHGGADAVMHLRWVYCLMKGLPLDTNVYDLATWSSIVELSERSVNAGSRPIDIPDFTRGAWKTNKPFETVDVDLKTMGIS